MNFHNHQSSFDVNNIHINNITFKDQSNNEDTGFGSLHWEDKHKGQNQVNYATAEAKYGPIRRLFIEIGLSLK